MEWRRCDERDVKSSGKRMTISSMSRAPITNSDEVNDSQVARS